MLYTTKVVNIDFISNKDSLYFLDIETTGLCKLNDTIYAIGLAQYINKSIIFHQWHIEKKEDEYLILKNLFSILDEHARIYTYNGKNFDIKFVQSKAIAYNLPLDMSWQWIDLKDLATFKYLIKNYDTKRKSLESLISYTRSFSTAGKELAKLIKLTLEHPSPLYNEAILGHNYEETLSLIYFYQLHQFLLSISPIYLTNTSSIVSESIDPVVFTFKCIYPLGFSINLVLPPYSINYSASDTYVTLSIDVYYEELLHYLNPKDYFIVDNKLLHASLASFIPSTHKVRPKKHECFLKQKGYFLPCSCDTKDRTWTDENKNTYLMLSPDCDLDSVLNTFIKKLNLITKK